MSIHWLEFPPALDTACAEGNFDAAMSELESFLKANPSVSRQKALTHCALKALDKYHIDFLRACLDRGGMIIDPSDKDINQAFAFRAIACDDLPMLKLYLEKGQLPLDIGSSYTGDMLNSAAMDNALTVATWLLDEKKIDVNSDKAMYNQAIPVVVAASWPDDTDDTRFLELLLDRGVTFQGTGAICEAAKEGHTRAVERLLQAGADREEVITHGMEDERMDLGTPLWLAAGQGRDDTVEFLTKAGANLHYRDPRYNLTPLLIARVRGHEDCADLVELALQEEKNKKEGKEDT